jgi:hypothetical protein
MRLILRVTLGADIAPPGNAVADFFPAKTGVFIRVHK